MGGWYSDAPRSDKDEKQSANLARLLDKLVAGLTQAIAGNGRRYDTALLCELHAIAMRDVVTTAGEIRAREVKIRGSRRAG